jgi:IclR helix-turn-helix domain
MGGEERRGIKAIEVAGHILDVLARTQTPVALRELAAAGHMSPGKVHRYLASFLASGLRVRTLIRAAMHLARSPCGSDLRR